MHREHGHLAREWATQGGTGGAGAAGGAGGAGGAGAERVLPLLPPPMFPEAEVETVHPLNTPSPLYCTPSPTYLYRCISETGGAPLPLVHPLTPPGGAGLRGCGGDAEVCPRRARLAVRGDSKYGHSTYSEMAGSTRCAILTMTMLTTTITASRAYCQPRFAITLARANPGCISL